MNTNPIIKLPVAELKTAIGGLTKVIARHTTLPVLGMIHVERDRQGWVHLTGTDLDTFLTLRLEAPQQSASPHRASCPSPSELQKLGKTCPADEVLDLEVLAEDKLLLRHRIGSHPVEQVITSCPRSGTSRSRRRSPRNPSAWTKRPAPRCSTPWPVPATTRRVSSSTALISMFPNPPATTPWPRMADTCLPATACTWPCLPPSLFPITVSFPGAASSRTASGSSSVQRRRRTRAAISNWRAAAGRSRPSRSRARTPTGATSPTMCASLAAPSRSAIRRRRPWRASCPGCRGRHAQPHRGSVHRQRQVVPARL